MPRYRPQDFTIVSPVNDTATLAKCLAASPDVAGGHVGVRIVTDGRSANGVIADALDTAATPFVVYAHQDVYFPSGFFATLADRVEALDAVDPRWAVAGAIGRDAAQVPLGRVWSTDRGQVVGTVIDGPVPVECLDECLLILRAGDAALVDTRLPGFHLYGVDLVQMGRRAGRRSYALPLDIVHHAKPLTSLGGGYAEGHRYMRRKWRASLPLTTLIAPLERVPWRLWKMRVGARVRARFVRPAHGYTQASDPRSIARELGYE